MFWPSFAAAAEQRICWVRSPFSSGCWGRRYRCASAGPIGRSLAWGRSWRGRRAARERGRAGRRGGPHPGAARSPGGWCSCWPGVASRSWTTSWWEQNHSRESTEGDGRARPKYKSQRVCYRLGKKWPARCHNTAASLRSEIKNEHMESNQIRTLFIQRF